MAPRSWFAIAAVAACFLGCGDDETAPAGSTGTGATGGGAGTDPPPPGPISAKATVKVKSVERLVADVAQVLSLAPEELCHEVSGDACADVHAIALGGTDAYDSGVYEPLAASTATSPIAVDRIVMSACRVRADQDLAAPETAVIYGGLAVAADGTLDPGADAVESAVTTLYRRALLRDPKAPEHAHLASLYASLVEAGATDEPARDWATLSCFSVLTTMEFLFY